MNRRVPAVLLGAALLLPVAVVAIPVFVIMPFKSQTPGGVALSFALERWSPWVTLLSLAAAISLVVSLWRGSVIWKRILLILALVPVGISVWFARQNHFEWMFNPLGQVARVEVLRADFVQPGDMVLGIVVNQTPMAYPVNQVAYHHVVNDTVGGVPIAATY